MWGPEEACIREGAGSSPFPTDGGVEHPITLTSVEWSWMNQGSGVGGTCCNMGRNRTEIFTILPFMLIRDYAPFQHVQQSFNIFNNPLSHQLVPCPSSTSKQLPFLHYICIPEVNCAMTPQNWDVLFHWYHQSRALVQHHGQ